MTTTDSERALEKDLIAMLMGDQSNLHLIESPVLPEEIGNADLRDIYKAILALDEAHFAPTRKRIAAQLQRDKIKVNDELLKELEQRKRIGDPNFVAYMVGEYAAERALRQVPREMLTIAESRVGTLDERHAKMQAKLTNVLPRASGRLRARDAAELLKCAADKARKRTERENSGVAQVGFPTHWGIDPYAEGIEDGNIAMLTGRTGSGKTTGALEIADYNIAVAGAIVVYVHLETAPEDIARRLITRHTGIPRQYLLHDKAYDFRPRGLLINKETRSAIIEESVTSFYGDGFYALHMPGANVGEITARIGQYKRIAEHQGRQFIAIVDYLTKIATGAGTVDWHEWVPIISALKNHAEAWHYPLVLLAQENKDTNNKGVAFTSEAERQCQWWISIVRDIANQNAYATPEKRWNEEKNRYDLSGLKVGHDGDAAWLRCDGSPMMWHQAGKPSSSLRLEIVKRNEGDGGVGRVRFMGHRYMWFGSEIKTIEERGVEREVEVITVPQYIKFP